MDQFSVCGLKEETLKSEMTRQSDQTLLNYFYKHKYQRVLIQHKQLCLFIHLESSIQKQCAIYTPHYDKSFTENII